MAGVTINLPVATEAPARPAQVLPRVPHPLEHDALGRVFQQARAFPDGAPHGAAELLEELVAVRGCSALPQGHRISSELWIWGLRLRLQGLEIGVRSFRISSGFGVWCLGFMF